MHIAARTTLRLNGSNEPISRKMWASLKLSASTLFKNMAGDPRYTAFLRKMNLPS